MATFVELRFVFSKIILISQNQIYFFTKSMRLNVFEYFYNKGLQQTYFDRNIIASKKFLNLIGPTMR